MAVMAVPSPWRYTCLPFDLLEQTQKLNYKPYDLLHELLGFFYFYIKNILVLSLYRQKLLKTYSSGKQHWKKLLHRLQMQLLWWDIMEYFVMTQQMYTKGLFQIVGALLPLQFILSCGELSIHLFSYISSVDWREREETYQITSCWQANTTCTGRYRWQSFFSRKSFAFPWETW